VQNFWYAHRSIARVARQADGQQNSDEQSASHFSNVDVDFLSRPESIGQEVLGPENRIMLISTL
jgi:hypothetical protein